MLGAARLWRSNAAGVRRASTEPTGAVGLGGTADLAGTADLLGRWGAVGELPWWRTGSASSGGRSARRIGTKVLVCAGPARCGPGAAASRRDASGARLPVARVSRCRTSPGAVRLRDARLRDARLRDARLTDARLTDARLTDARLTDARLTDARLRGRLAATGVRRAA
ncbi:pentapeptide repeat-containing protein [Kitasatospora sp. NBC_01287]|uniref:pentapeptide repeat-containing protein n=1 Tax=Kitasatospora sp. NBC_01287 TaxID=2903573 RepID=UPI002B1CF6E7|nr:pentapeptide repeat-containing protein [Kitasatospora sp. NBC_01287]